MKKTNLVWMLGAMLILATGLVLADSRDEMMDKQMDAITKLSFGRGVLPTASGPADPDNTPSGLITANNQGIGGGFGFAPNAGSNEGPEGGLGTGGDTPGSPGDGNPGNGGGKPDNPGQGNGPGGNHSGGGDGSNPGGHGNENGTDNPGKGKDK